MSLVGPIVAILYVLGGLLMMTGIIVAGLALAAPFMFAANLLDARAYTMDYLGWVPGVTDGNTYVGSAALAVGLLVAGLSLLGLGSLMMALPGLV